MVRLVKHGLEECGFESIGCNDKSLSENQLDHEMVDRFVEVVVKAVLEKVVREIDDELVEEVELEWWFEQDIDVEEKKVEEDEDGGEV
ncbi:hypothetical protein Tco_0981630 [Tanacetum coccineum]